jgi:hypothetical protein
MPDVETKVIETEALDPTQADRMVEYWRSRLES